MTRKLLLFLVSAFFAFNVSAQTGGISGIIKDTLSHGSVKNAVVSLLTPKDSILKGFTRVKEDGSYSIQNIAPGNYILSITHPVFADFVDDILIKSSDEKLAPVALTPKSKLLEAVIVKSGNPIRLKGDTTIYTADSFRVSANANVEELLKKLPGIQVDKDGKIKAMGQTVEKVLVDGEEFFGDDPGMAVKNLRADAVKEVQVFDKKSEQAEFTGIDDGNTQKTINLKLKEDKKKGYFGKIDLAGGLQNKIDDRYNSNILLSSFKGKRKLTGFLLNGNTGQDGLSWEDEQKFGGNDNLSMSMDDDGNTMFQWRGGGSDDEPYLNPENGFMTNVNAGIQYSNKWNDKTSLNFAPKYNSQRYNNHQETYSRTLYQGDSALIQNSTGNTFINRSNIKLRGIYDVKIDSFNTLKFTANANFYKTQSTDSRDAITTDQSSALKNASDRLSTTNSDKEAYSINAIFKHKFKKLRRTLSLTADANSVSNSGLNFLHSLNDDYFFNTTTLIDQMKDYDKSTSNLSTKLTYTEPLGKRYSLELGYQLSINHGTNDLITYTPGAVTPSKYDVKIDSLSNQFRQNILQNIPSAKINYTYKKLKANIGAGISFTDFKLKDLSSGIMYNRNYSNFFPQANFTYSYKSNHSLRINYSGSTRQPTIDQLQPLTKNDDPFNLYLGNPGLKPSFSNTFNLSHNAYDFKKDIWMYQSLNVSLTENAITNRRLVNLSNGTSVTQPLNVNGNYYINFYGGAGFKLKKIDTRLNFNLNGGLNRSAIFINGVKTFSNNINSGLSGGLSKSKEKKYDLSIYNNVNYNVQKTTLTAEKTHFVTNTLTFDGTVYYQKVWSLQSGYVLTSRGKTEQAKGTTQNILNAKLQRTFKKDEFSIYVSVQDLLNQNIGIDRNFSYNSFYETRNDRLQRYWLVGLRWDFKNKAPKAK